MVAAIERDNDVGGKEEAHYRDNCGYSKSLVHIRQSTERMNRGNKGMPWPTLTMERNLPMVGAKSVDIRGRLIAPLLGEAYV